jgi:putative flippase GtrA
MTEKLRFLAVGVYNTAFGYLVFAVLYLWLHERLHYLIIAILAHTIAVASAFTMHRHIVFRSKDPLLPSFIRFNLSTAISLAFSLSGMALLVETFGTSPLVAQAIVTCLAVMISYLLHRHYTFRT